MNAVTAPETLITHHTTERLTSGLATFTLTGCGRRYTFQVERAASTSPGSSPLYFARVATANGDFAYLGVYQPDYGWLKLTAASKIPDTDERVRCFRWFVGAVWNLREHEVEANGFKLEWFDEGSK